MADHIFIAFAQPDEDSANWLRSQLVASNYPCIVQNHIDPPVRVPEHALNARAIIALISPDTETDEKVMRICAAARQSDLPLLPTLVRFTDHLPWYVEKLPVYDLTHNLEHGFASIIDRLPAPATVFTMGKARDMYLQRATLRSSHTIDAYRRSIDLFLMFLETRSKSHLQAGTSIEDMPLSDLSEEDAPILLQFAQWLLSPATDNPADKRPYKPSTVELRVAGVQNWLQYLDDHGRLPGAFKLAKAKRIVQDELSNRTRQSRPPQPPENLEEVIYFYDSQELPAHLRKPDVDSERVQRWQLSRLRNRALLHSLAETGGRVSEVLSLNLGDFPPRYLNRQDVLRVEVRGKGGHTYYLRFHDALPALRAYIEARGADLKASLDGRVPLFISHARQFQGNRMSRTIAWRVVQRAARSLGLKSITPHDFRHWRATQLINAGHSLEVVQEYLGHRSVETTRAYYAHTDPLRVDDAAKTTGLPDVDELE